IQDSSVPVLLGDHAYDLERGGALVCIEIATGKIQWKVNQGRHGGASLTSANGHLYVRNGNGIMSLVQATPREYAEKSTFQIPGHQEALNGPPPVIAGGRLYLRENDVLLCYDIRADALARAGRDPRVIVLPPPGAMRSNLGSVQRPRNGKDRTPDAIFVPTPRDVVDKMLELAQVTRKDVVYDLGSGDGRIVIAAAKKYGCKAVGYEIDSELVKL